MILLDTNIVSVLMTPDHADTSIIQAWRASLLDEDLRTASVTEAEIFAGLAVLPDGARKRRMIAAAEAFFAPGTVLAFDSRAAREYAVILAARRAVGHPIGILDAQIAAIARADGATVATRNVRDFEDCSVQIANPYASAY